MKLRQERQSCGSCKNADDQPRLSVVVAARGTMSCTHAAATPTPRAAFAFDAETQRQRHMWQMQRWQPQQVVAAFSHAHIIIAIDASCTRCTRAAFSTLSSLRQIRCVVYDSPPPTIPPASSSALGCMLRLFACHKYLAACRHPPPVASHRAVGPSNNLSQAKVDCYCDCCCCQSFL